MPRGKQGHPRVGWRILSSWRSCEKGEAYISYQCGDSTSNFQSQIFRPEFATTILVRWVCYIPVSIVVRTPGFHPGNPGSIPGLGVFCRNFIYQTVPANKISTPAVAVWYMAMGFPYILLAILTVDADTHIPGC